MRYRPLVTPLGHQIEAALAAGTLVGGQVGAAVAHRIPAGTLRVLIALMGLVAGLWLIARQL